MPIPQSQGWREIGPLETESEVIGVAAAPAGYVVVEYSRTAWFSVDGRAWTKTVLPFPANTDNGFKLGAHANDIAGGPSGFVVVGGQDVEPCSGFHGAGGPPPCMVEPISWTSTDGLTWRSSRSNPIPLDGSELPAYSEIVQVWPAGDGWDAAVERSGYVPSGNGLLHTVDGRRWTLLQPAPLPPGATSGLEVNAHAGVATADGLRLVWQIRYESRPSGTWLAISPDGASWRDVAGVGGADLEIPVGLAPEDGVDANWVLLGNTSIDGQSVVLSWVSEDMVDWRAGQVGEGSAGAGDVFALERWSGRYIALGWMTPRYSKLGTWVSSDGSTWSIVEAMEPSRTDLPALLAAGQAGLLGIGSNEAATTVWIWIEPET